MPEATTNPSKIRNVAIIAHVDHGKTTLVDGLLKQSHTFRYNQAEMSQDLIMDSSDQERERGITITAKVTAVNRGDYRINIIDTPGHADFSGEVERTLNMADGCLLIIDAQEGPMPQTKFVLSRALAAGLKPIVVINKIDKPSARVAQVEHELGDLFLELAAHEDQLHYPIYYAVAREGKAWAKLPDDLSAEANLDVIFDAIISDIPAPKVEPDAPLQMLVTALAWDNFKGKYAIGRVSRGQVSPGDAVALIKAGGVQTEGKIDGVYLSHGVSVAAAPKGLAGDIVRLTGLPQAAIGDTIAAAAHPEALPTIEVEAPTLRMYLGPNTSPFKGLEGSLTTSRQIKERLAQELETNVGLRVEPSSIGFEVSGRGELHLSVLIETMRREGFELEVGRPQVVTHEEAGKVMEPLEELIIEVPTEHVGTVQMELGTRRAKVSHQAVTAQGLTRIVCELPTRALLGLRSILMTRTKGTVIMNSLASGYQPMGVPLPQLRNGVLIAFETGTTTPYALQTAESRGTCYVPAAIKVYAGQIVGLSSRLDDMEINVCKTKHLTNMRSSSSDGVVQLVPPVIFSLEECLDFLENDELLEVTPKSLRLRKRELDPHKRKRAKHNA